MRLKVGYIGVHLFFIIQGDVRGIAYDNFEFRIFKFGLKIEYICLNKIDFNII